MIAPDQPLVKFAELAYLTVKPPCTALIKQKIEDFQVRLSFENAKKLIGEEIPRETIKSILTSLEIKVNNVTETGLGLTVPAYRNDVQREADVIEEILRVYGYNSIKTTDKLNASISNSSRFEDYKVQNVIGNFLAAQGFFEIMGNSLTTPNYTKLSEELKDSYNVVMLNPLSADLGVMRQSMLFSGLEAVSHNINRRKSDLKLFEFGKTYHNFDGNREEFKHLSLFVTGNKTQERWNSAVSSSDFFYLKGIVESLLERLGIHKYSYSPTSKSEVSNLKTPPASIKLESNVSPKSAELVAVCAAASALTHSTMCPCCTTAKSGS